MKKLFLMFFILSLLLIFFIPVLTVRAGLVPCGEEGNPCTLCHFFLLIKNIYDFLIKYVAPAVGGLLIVWGGFIFLTAGGSQEKVSKAKKIMSSVIIGLVIVYGSWVLLNFIITSDLVAGNIDGFVKENWYKFGCQ